ncbi:MAG: hypothetical protein GVY08_15185 [Bacteroidetes bacterium]|jgi:hypothetical protein|nr:hypothetical protein [Bacteroidota bacterium]
MSRNVDFRPVIYALAAGGFLLTASLIIFPGVESAGWIAGYAVGLMAIVLHFLQYHVSKRLGNDDFFSLYGPMVLMRLFVILCVFIGLLIWQKFDQFSFTVSFLISYIYHSVINIYLINKELTKRSG